MAAVRDTAGSVVGAVMGLLPHVLHHVGLIAGTAFLAGAGGNALLFALGLLLSVPMLRRIHRRFRTWVAPAIAVAVFTGMFALSALVIGPALTGGDDDRPEEVPFPGPTPVPSSQHTEHHT
jgi:hypothetical protein